MFLIALCLPAFAMASEIDHALSGIGAVIMLGIGLLVLLIVLAILAVFVQVKWLKALVILLATFLFLAGLMLSMAQPILGLSLCLISVITTVVMVIKLPKKE